MAESILYHEGSRGLQDVFESRRIADRLEARTMHTEFTEGDAGFIEGASFFFLATADREGRPDVSFKGGTPGFVRVAGPSELVFPDYDGNGMFKSLGNITVNPSVALLFINFERPGRLRINGTAAISRDDPLLAHTVGAQMIVRVAPRAIFPNCPRYIPTMRMVEPSIYVPRPGVAPVEPAWKSFPVFADAIHPRQKTASGAEPEQR
jgi:predicted pyridoxine 5'-phosphate oxidase superfamily flavin-nucleotide-binding protein